MSFGPSRIETAADLCERLAARFGPASSVTPLAPDASVRSFFRLSRRRGRSRVALVDRDGGVPALDRMAAARDLLSGIGVRVPRLEDRDDEIPALLFEDFGDTLLADALPSMTPDARRAAYSEAGRIAGLIAARGTPRVVDDHPLLQPALGRERLRWELALFATQDVAGRRAVADHGLFRDLASLSDRICREIAAAVPKLAHRDFHARNFLLLPDGKLGILDFQDTLFAPPYYDLASLVRDPYVEPDGELERAAAAAYASIDRTAPSPLDDPLFAWVALQRDLKAIGTYSSQARLRKRTRFLEYIPVAERLVLRAADALPAEYRQVARDVLSRIGIS